MQPKISLILLVESVGNQKTDIGLKGLPIPKPGEYIKFHYYPPITENVSNKYTSFTAYSKAKNLQLFAGQNPRRFDLKNILFNDYGDPDIKLRTVKFTDYKGAGKRQGFMNTNDSLQFLRSLAQPSLRTSKIEIIKKGTTKITGTRNVVNRVNPPIIKIINFLDEPIRGVIQNLNIKPEIIDLQEREIEIQEGFSEKLFILEGLKKTITIKRILRARVDISFLETIDITTFGRKF